MGLFRRITNNSNAYAQSRVKRGSFVGYKWVPIKVEEMIKFFGIMLKISIHDLNLGGYDAYWDKDIRVNARKNYHVKLFGIESWM